MPVYAKLADGTYRLVYADREVKAVIQSLKRVPEARTNAYVINVKDEQEFKLLRRLFFEEVSKVKTESNVDKRRALRVSFPES